MTLPSWESISRETERLVSGPSAFLAALVVVLVWALTGPLFSFSDTWQLVINTGTTIVTFLMVFLIQATQSRDTRAIHLKLDELVRTSDARNLVMEAETMDQDTLDKLLEEQRRQPP